MAKLGLKPLSKSDVFPVHFSGTVKLLSCHIDEGKFIDLKDPKDHQVFMYCWMDKDRGNDGRVTFPEVGSPGLFELSLPLHAQDLDLLKIMCCMRMLDEESGNYRTVTFASSAAHLEHLMQGEEQHLIMKDQMKPSNQAEVTIRAVNAIDFANHPDCRTRNNSNTPMISFTRSALWDVPLFNSEMDMVSKDICSRTDAHKMGIPPGGGGFAIGLSSWEWGGADLEAVGKGKIPPLKTHYALMGAQEESLDRVLPIGIVVYHLYLSIYHSGMTMAAILKLSDPLFGKFVAQALQITRDPGLTPYERDFVPGLAVSFTRGITIQATGTENMALPCGAPQFLGRVLRRLKTIQVQAGTSMDKLRSMLAELVEELYTGILYDDCESTAQLAVLARMTCLTIPESHTELQAHLAGWPLFNALTAACWEGLAQIINRGNAMLRSGYLTVVTSVGLATNASVSDVENDKASYNGHCFNVGCVQGSSMQVGSGMQSHSTDQRPECFLLEGTSAMTSVRVSSTSPKLTLRVRRGPDPTVYTTEVYNAADGYTMLGMWISEATRIANAPKGGQPEGGGWPGENKLTGWVGRLMVMNSLDSDPSSHLSFYNRVMYMGWPCVEGGQGCMPVQESKGSLAGPGAPAFVTGCHPYDLNSLDIRGISAGVSQDKKDLIRRVMNEAHPPMVDHAVLKQLSSYWAPCIPLEDVNVEANAMREKGVEYFRIASMETPGVPEHIPIFYEAKRQLMHRANQLNMARHDTDGIMGIVAILGTGVHVFLDVPMRDLPSVTYVESLKQAMEELKWPGYVPDHT